MSGTVVQLENVINADTLAMEVAKTYNTWHMLRFKKEQEWEEIRKYVYATNTTTTSNADLPWKNKTTIPKLTQIRDNLIANYMASLFPKRKWLVWEADTKKDNLKAKKEAIENYMGWVLTQPEVKEEFAKLIQDYIDNGNCVGTVEWADFRVQQENKDQVGYVGPLPKRISPYDIVFNPIAPSFRSSPKIVRSLVSLGEAKEIINRFSKPEDLAHFEEIWNYMRNLRKEAHSWTGELHVKDEFLNVDGFTSYQAYLGSGQVEILTFYGDVYLPETDELLKNHQIVVADRHVLIDKKPIPGYWGSAPMFHASWRRKQDNLWGMGPLDNLVGMQYRLDHIENLKADSFDLLAFPMLHIKGHVEDFEWEPFGRIYTGDDGEVNILAPPAEVLNANLELQSLEQKMEEMAGAPKEAMGFRTPGEKTAYEVQRLENAASRIFYNKILQFEDAIVEPLVNAMLELARRNLDTTQIRVFDEEYDITTFKTLTRNDILGSGRIKPVAAKHFAEKAEQIQNITNFFTSPLGQNPSVLMHFSGVALAKMAEEILNIEQYQTVTPYIQVSEQAEAMNLQNSHMEQSQMQAGTATGLTPDDVDLEAA